MAWTLVCPTEIKALDAAAGQFAARHATVLLISTDSEFSLLSWNRTAAADGGLGGVAVPLLSDKSLQISRAYGVLQEDKGVALRATFLIDRAGIVRQVSPGR